MKASVKNAFFRNIPVVEGSDVLARLTRRKFSPGEQVFSEGAEAGILHVVDSGYVKLMKSAGDTTILLRVFGPGESLGEMPVSTRSTYPATAIAVRKTVTVDIARNDLEELKRRFPKFSEESIARMSSNARFVQQRLVDISLKSIEARLACFLLELAPFGRAAENGALKIPIPLLRADLAAAAHIRVETVIRLMSRWKREGLAESGRTGITIRNLKALQELSRLP